MSNPFPAPACAACNDTGERIEETPTSIGLLRETVPCDCPAGLLLAAQISERITQFWATVPLTKQENNRG